MDQNFLIMVTAAGAPRRVLPVVAATRAAAPLAPPIPNSPTRPRKPSLEAGVRFFFFIYFWSEYSRLVSSVCVRGVWWLVCTVVAYDRLVWCIESFWCIKQPPAGGLKVAAAWTAAVVPLNDRVRAARAVPERAPRAGY